MSRVRLVTAGLLVGAVLGVSILVVIDSGIWSPAIRSAGVEWLRVPEGNLQIGCVDELAGEFGRPSQKCDSNEDVVSRASMSVAVEGFWLAKFETTVEQYALCAEAGACNKRAKERDYDQSTCNWRNGRLQHPMNCLDWDEATSFCQWVAGRLPSMVEWEYAAKGGRFARHLSQRVNGHEQPIPSGWSIYPWGDILPSGRFWYLSKQRAGWVLSRQECCNGGGICVVGPTTLSECSETLRNEGFSGDADLGARANFCDRNCPKALAGAAISYAKNGWISADVDDGWSATSPVGQFGSRSEARWGHADMAGNVWEWTSSDWVSKVPDSKLGGSKKEIRGGAWDSTPSALRTSARAGQERSSWNDHTGFRCAK
ncbi:MAG: formylglycine-generating enzyme family protein [Myxococcaceae bacterium]